MYYRINFVRHFLDLCRNLLPPTNAYSQNNDVKFTPKFKEAACALACCQEALKKIESSWNLGSQPTNEMDDGK